MDNIMDSVKRVLKNKNTVTIIGVIAPLPENITKVRSFWMKGKKNINTL